jgi:nucleotide-binding universal stress UspA family protein
VFFVPLCGEFLVQIMSQTGPGFSLIGSVLHPTDFSMGSLVAFNHALKAAMLARSKLTLLHVSSDRDLAWSDFPGVRETLERWKVLPQGSPRSAVGEIGIDARKVVANERDPVEAVIRYVEKHPADLIVLAITKRDGHAHWLDKQVAEPVTRKAGEMTLLIPSGVEGFVSAQDGSINLSRILIPVALTPRPQPALNAAARIVEKFKCPQGTFTIVHVGTEATMPAFKCPEVAGWTWETELVNGEVIKSIVTAAKSHKADLVVMATDGRNGFLDGLRGSHSERVLRYGVVPLLTVPIGSRVSRFLI